MIPWLESHAIEFPPIEQALTEPDGLLCAGGDLSPETLKKAYARGIFPWFSEEDPILWWSPDPRMVLFPKDLHLSRSVRKKRRNTPFEISYNHDFDRVIGTCAAPRSQSPGTWILPEMHNAYNRLHEQGLAHSVEVWLEGELVGGLYGVLLGPIFFGESMFSKADDASKIALLGLSHWLQPVANSLIDCQIYSPHLERLGARLIPRKEFCAHLDRTICPTVAALTPPSKDRIDVRPLLRGALQPTDCQPGTMR